MLTLFASSHTLKVMAKKFALKQFGTQLWSRETARPIRARLSDMLETLSVGEVLSIDASGVDVFDFSFASELFGKGLSRLGVDYPGRAAHGVPPEESPRQFRPDGSYPPDDLSWYANIPVPTSYMITATDGDFFGGYET